MTPPVVLTAAEQFYFWWTVLGVIAVVLGVLSWRRGEW